jgi:hypothetical protein
MVSREICCAELVGIEAAAATISEACSSMEADLGYVERGY